MERASERLEYERAGDAARQAQAPRSAARAVRAAALRRRDAVVRLHGAGLRRRRPRLSHSSRPRARARRPCRTTSRRGDGADAARSTTSSRRSSARRRRSRRTRSTSCCCCRRGSGVSRGAGADERGRAASRRSPPHPEQIRREAAATSPSPAIWRAFCILRRARALVRATATAERRWQRLLATDDAGAVHQHAPVARLSGLRRARRLPRPHARQDLRDARRRGRRVVLPDRRRLGRGLSYPVSHFRVV